MSDMPDYVRALYTSVKNTWQDAENLDDTHGYTTYVWIPEETYKVDIMKLHVFAEKFRAYSKAAASGGGTVVTSEYTSIPHTHDVAIGTKTSVASGGHSHTVSGVTSSSTSIAHTHDVTIGNHTHDVVIGTKTSVGGGSHRHLMFKYQSETTPSDVWYLYECQIANGNYSGIDLMSLVTEDLYTYETVANHTHDVNIGTVTSAAGGGTTVTSASGGGSHSHDVTLPNHTHDITYGIYEDAITGRTLSAILYDPDGNLLEDFGVVCTGEDSQIIDLSDYFSTLKYGMYRLELSASGRLRARLVFYELCKMYAI